ncbi:MAG: phage major capsid protein, partial [Clostridia bacterium]|nr:phage major capsid protein [Clostridia bacterium]
NLLNDEMDNMVKSASVNFGRMLFGDGSGKLATVKAVSGGNVVTVDSVKNVFEGMRVYTFSAASAPLETGPRQVLAVNRNTKTVKLSGDELSITTLPVGSFLSSQAKLGCELTGLQAIFSKTATQLYGVDRSNYPFLMPLRRDEVGDISEEAIQEAIDQIEENSGSKVNFIVCSWGVKRALAAYYKQYNTVLASQQLDGGYNAVSFNGIPLVADRFCPEGTMYLLNSDDFCIHQLCDWQWLQGDDGKVLSKLPSKPVYAATLVKYAELMCTRPCGQGVLTGITEK